MIAVDISGPNLPSRPHVTPTSTRVVRLLTEITPYHRLRKPVERDLRKMPDGTPGLLMHNALCAVKRCTLARTDQYWDRRYCKRYFSRPHRTHRQGLFCEISHRKSTVMRNVRQTVEEYPIDSLTPEVLSEITGSGNHQLPAALMYCSHKRMNSLLCAPSTKARRGIANPFIFLRIKKMCSSVVYKLSTAAHGTSPLSFPT